jgi:hypothetical protein
MGYAAMTNDPFGRPSKRAEVQRSVPWTLTKNGHTYTCELKFWENGGSEAQIMKDDDLPVSRRFEKGWQALQWAEEERKHREKRGGLNRWVTEESVSRLSRKAPK